MSLDGGLASPGTAGPLAVHLNVYDVAQQGDGKGTVVRLNNLVGPRGLGLGGVFHGAIVLGTVEFSFGFCEQGTGVYAVKAGMNPMYTFRETIDLGATHKSMQEIRSIIQQLKQEWPGSSYDLLYRNCCHFCVDLAARLEVGPVPGWLNRFASGAAATINMTQDTVKTVQEFGAEVGRFWNRTLAAASHQQQQLAEKLQQQQQHWRSGAHEQQERDGGSPPAPRSSQLAGRTSQAGQQIWSGLTQAGQQLRATTSKLAQAAATSAKSGSGGPRFGSFSLASMSLTSSTSPYVMAGGDEDPLAAQQQQQHQQQQRQQQQQQQQPNGKSSWAQQPAAPAGTAAAASAAGADAGAAGAAAGASTPLQGMQGPLGPADRASSLLLGAQPKLSKQYRLSGGGPQQQQQQHPFASDAAAARAAAGSTGGGSAGGRLAPCASDDGLMPFLSVDDAADPFVALVGDDDAEDDAQQKAAVEHAVHLSPAEPAGA